MIDPGMSDTQTEAYYQLCRPPSLRASDGSGVHQAIEWLTETERHWVIAHMAAGMIRETGAEMLESALRYVSGYRRNDR